MDNLDKRRSLTAYVFTLRGCVISWKATLQSTIALLTTEVEYIVITEGVKEAIWVKGLLEKILVETGSIFIFCDSQSAIQMVKDQMYHDRSKHIDVKFYFVRQVTSSSIVKIKKIAISHNPADMMTKLIPTTKFNYCVELISVWS
jgi:hypothetical protein